MSSIVHGLVVPGHYFPLAYALIVGTGLVMALVLGMRLHFTEIVKTHCKTPEYWPSISATTGDFAPERFVWRGAFVLAAMFRFTSGFLSFKFFAQQDVASAATRAAGLVSTRVLVYAALVCELLRCVSAMGWTVISSGEDNLHHNASFAVYMIVGFVLQVSQVVIVGRVRGTYANGSMSMSVKKVCLIGQTICALCVGFFYVRHHQTCAPGAYSRSTMCEWMFALFNVLFDASQGFELQNERVSFGVSGGEPHVLKLASVPSNAVMMVSDVFFSYFTVASVLALLQAAYFMPMVAMEFTWEVALLFGVAAPALAYIPKLRSFLQSRRFFGAHGYVLFYITAILSLFCFDVTHNPGRRIWTTSIGGISILLATFTRYLHTPSLELLEGERARINYALPLGFAVSMIIRVMFVSADPLYTNAIYNAFLGIVFGLWCAWIQFRRSAYAPAPVSTPSVEDGKTPAGTNAPAFSPVVLGIAFGNCLSLSLIMVSSSGFIPRLLGLDPWPSGGLVILAFLLGLYLSSTVVPTFRNSRGGNILSTIAQAPVLVALFVVGFLVMYLGTRQSNRSFEKPHAHYPINWETPREHVKLSDWTTEEDFRGSPELALLGGCAIVFALGTVWPQLMDLLFTFLRCKQPKANVRWFKSMELTYGVIVAIHLLMQVYVVCHPFVPLGWILRDRLDFTLSVAILGTLVPTLVAARAASQTLTATDTSEASVLKFRAPPVKTLVMVVGLFLCCIFGRIIGTPDSHSVAPQLTTLHDKLSDVLSVSKELQDFELQLNKFDEPRLSEAFRKFSIASIEEKRDAFKRNVEHKMGSDVLHAAEQTTPFSAMIWTVHFAIDNFNVDGLSRMVDLIKETKAGVIGLLESDSVRVHTGNRDLVEYIAYHLGYDYTDYGPTAFDGTFGCALITKYPILYSRRYVLPSPLGELACLIHAKLDLFGVETNVYVGHWGNTQHWADGVLQSEFLGELVQRNPGPSVFLGYLVTKPQLGNYNYYASASEPGKFRDTALQLYKQRPWRRLTNLGGYVEQVSAEDQQLAEVDQQYHRPPEGADARYFYFEDTQRYSTAHPRWEFVDRYCQYILYKTGLPQDEKPEHAGQLQPYHFELVDWWRVLDIHELSDTEIQVVQLALRAGHKADQRELPHAES